MFDWNDEELTNVLWGEAGERDDHIVPYPDQIEDKHAVLYENHYNKETDRQGSDARLVQQQKPTLDDIEETSNLDKDSEIFEKPTADGEESDFVDYGWANIGSFDDLDRIFSNNDPIFGDLAVANADELWSSSKDITNIPIELTPLAGDSSNVQLESLRTSTDKSEIEDHNVLDPSQSSTSGYGKRNEIKYQAPHDVQAFVTKENYQGSHKVMNTGTASNLAPDKDSRQSRLSRGQKLDRKNEVSLQHESRIPWTSSGIPLRQVRSQFVPSEVKQPSSLTLAQQRSSLVQNPPPFQLKNFSGIPSAAPFYGNVMSHHPAAPVLVPPFSESPATNVKNSQDSSKKSPRMTPKEKIEKLRKRQQMRAILAIQNQQVQFNNQVSVPENSSLEKGKVSAEQNVNSFLIFDPNSPAEQDDSSTISMVFDNCSVEESVLYRLQDTIAKMDMQIRLCIRDSLFRLAQSAIQRQYPNDTSSIFTNSKDEPLNKDIVGNNRFSRVPDVETETNPIDRIVARLLFHRPLDLSVKLAGCDNSQMTSHCTFPEEAEASK